MPWVIILSTVAALLGFFLGVRSKAVSKRRATEREKKEVYGSSYKALPPPPAPKPRKEKIKIPVESYTDHVNSQVEKMVNVINEHDSPHDKMRKMEAINKELEAKPKPKEPQYTHKKPRSWSTYEFGTFAKTSICHNCKVIAYYADMWTHQPCPGCGGEPGRHKPSKWDEKTKTWVETTAR
jgi:hypothetical protein